MLYDDRNIHLARPHLENVGLRKSTLKPSIIRKPALAFDWDHGVNASGDPLWRNTGILKAIVGAAGTGGAANPTKLGDLPGFYFASGDYLNAGNNSELNYTATTFCGATWFTIDITGTAWYFQARGVYGVSGYLLYVGIDGSLRFFTNDAGGSPTATYASTGASSLSTTSRHCAGFLHLAGGKNYIWLDGVYKNESTAIIDPATSSDNFVIGATSGGGSTHRGNIYTYQIGEFPSMTKKAFDNIYKAYYQETRHIFGV